MFTYNGTRLVSQMYTTKNNAVKYVAFTYNNQLTEIHKYLSINAFKLKEDCDYVKNTQSLLKKFSLYKIKKYNDDGALAS